MSPMATPYTQGGGGRATVTTLAGSVQTAGYADGTGSAALFNSPDGDCHRSGGFRSWSRTTTIVIRKFSRRGCRHPPWSGPPARQASTLRLCPTTLNVPVGLVLCLADAVFDRRTGKTASSPCRGHFLMNKRRDLAFCRTLEAVELERSYLPKSSRAMRDSG